MGEISFSWRNKKFIYLNSHFIWSYVFCLFFFVFFCSCLSYTNNIAPDKQGYPDNIFSYFCTKTYVVGTHWGTSNEYHNISFHVEIRKISVFCVFFFFFWGKMCLIWTYGPIKYIHCWNTKFVHLVLILLGLSIVLAPFLLLLLIPG